MIASLQGDPSFLDEEIPLEGSAVAHIRDTRETLVYGDIPRDVRFPEDERLAHYGIQSLVRCPLERGGVVIGTIAYAREHGAFRPEEVALLEEVSRPMAAAVANSLAYEEIGQTFLLIYIYAFRVVGIFFLACIPLLLLFKRSRGGPVPVSVH